MCAMTRRLTRFQKDTILDRDAHICYYCGGEATVVDHIIPWDWCHDDSPSNLVSACNLCNQIASDNLFESLDEKRKYIMKARKKRRKRFSEGPFTCNQCGEVFVPCANNATNFVCSRCVELMQ